jgi:hypothetical protein
MKMRQSVPKRLHIKFRRQEITHKKANSKEELVRRCGPDVAGSELRPVADFEENGRESSDGIQVEELLECLSHDQLSKDQSERHYVAANFDSSSLIQSV